jgi:hypothetical protein
MLFSTSRAMRSGVTQSATSDLTFSNTTAYMSCGTLYGLTQVLVTP